ncbi:MAG TPA: GreA/GreB family elongation factor [Aequorivita sp.]|nr:GreA/GreB family elongation factor [Aequorivita sp.]
MDENERQAAITELAKEFKNHKNRIINEFNELVSKTKDDQNLKKDEKKERITKLENKMRKAKIIEEGKSPKGKVNIGSKVTVKDTKTRKIQDFIIVGATEADPFEGKISNESKVGEGLIGAKVGDKVDIEAPKGRIRYEVISINR